MALLNRLLLGHPGPFLAVALLSLIARAHSITGPLYSTDSYGALRPGGPTLEFFLAQGRYGTAVLISLRDALGYTGQAVSASALLLAIILLTHAALLLAHVVLRRPTGAEVTIFLVIGALHPFITEYFFFAEATLNIAVALWLSAASMFACARWRNVPLATTVSLAGLVLSLAIYQTAMTLTLGIAVLALVARLTAIDEPEDGGLLRSWQARLLAVVVVSVPVYLVSTRIVAWVTGVALNPLTSVSDALNDLPTTAKWLTDATHWALWPNTVLVPHLGSAVLILLMVLSTTAIAWAGIRRQRWVATAAALVLIAAGLVWAGGASQLSGPWIVPRRVVGIAVFTAGLLMLGWHASPARVRPAVFAVGLAILTIGYIGSSNQILFDQTRINRWDRLEASRVLARLEASPRYGNATSLALVGGRWSYPVWLSTTLGDMNMSIFGVPWSKLALFDEATGYRFADPTAEEWAAAEAYCDEVEPWPSQGSVTVIDSLGVVCIS